jgi:hypothetical protein
VTIGATLVFGLTVTLVGNIAANLPGTTESTSIERMRYAEYAAKVAYWFFFARLCLLFPAIAVDEEANLAQAWDRSRGNGWRLFVVICVLPLCVSQAIGYLYRDAATLIEYLLLTALGTVLIAVEVAALSLSYRQLVQQPISEQS